MEKPRLVLRANGSTFNPQMAKKYGNRWGIAKITDQQAEEIRLRYAAGRTTQQQLAEQYGISRGHISKIVGTAVWKQASVK